MVVPESSINNIMGGLESTGGVRLHNHKRKLKQRFDIVKKLGQGTYGKVQLGINKETGQEVAIKTIKKCKIETEADLIRIRREIQIMSSVQHPNIIHIYEVFENREKMVLVMEYAAGGELYDFLSERKVLAEEEARRIFRQIATAVYYCHKHKICHRDLKLENILLDENGNAKIADFGLSNVFEDSRLLSTFCGSPLYASPEIVKGTPYHGPEVDCWSLGVLLYTLVYGAMPFDGSNFKRLVRQISQGDYFEPKKPSPASPLIRDMLNINPARRADIVAICSHWWIDENQSEACMDVAEELANQTPVRLDLLLCLAPSGDNDKLLLADQPPVQEGGDRPLRSQSLSSLATAQPDFLTEGATQTRRDTESRSKRKEEGGSVKRKERSRSRRERSSSRSRRDDSTPEPDSVTEKPKRKSVKSKKSREEAQVVEESKEEETLQPRISEVEEELTKSSETILAPTTPIDEVPKAKSPVPSDEVVIEEIKNDEPTTPSTPVAPEVPKQPSPAPTPTSPSGLQQSATVILEKSVEKEKEKVSEDEKPAKPMERRKSKIFETAEKFNKIGTAEAQPKPQPKKMVLPGVKVSDAKKAYERRSSLASSTTNFVRGSASRKSLSGESSLSPPPVDDTKFSLASTVALNKLVENVEKLSKMEDEKEKSAEKSEETKSAENVKSSPEKVIEVKKEETKTDNEVKVEDEARKKVKNAVQVIGNAITEGISGDGKAATLPRRRTSRAEIKLSMPPPKPVEFRSEVEHIVGAPVAPAPAPTVQRSEVKFPVSAPSPRTTPVRQGSTPREYIVPIKMEQETTSATTATGTAVKPPPPPTTPGRPISRTSSKSLSRQSTADSDFGSTTSMGEPIRKSPREVIIPIAVEGGGYVTPSAEAISRMSSLNESSDDVPRGFGLHSTRRHARQLETADSVSSDEDDDNFEILTAENLFSTLLSRVRSLTQRLNTEDRQTAFPRLFNHHHSIFDIPPSRRLTEARSFGRADSVPWRRSMSRDTSTLPRDGSISRIGAHRTGSLKSSGKEKPPPYRTAVRNSAAEIGRSSFNPTTPSSSEQLVNENSSQPQNVTDTPGEDRPQSKVTNENTNGKDSKAQSLKGIPTAEITGSSVKKLSKSESKSESTKKSSKLPRLLVKSAQENRTSNEIAGNSSVSGDRESLENKSQSVPRRNSLERPSYYNSLYKPGFKPYNDSMTRSLNLPSDHVVNGESPANRTSTLNTDNLNKLDKYLTSSMIDGDRSNSEFDYHSIRPYGTLGRTFSLKNASGKSYGTLKTPVKLESDESKYSSPTSSISRGSSMKEPNQRSSRFLRPKSFYGGTDISSYSVPSSPSPLTSTGETMLDPFSERKSAFVSRRSPTYQRSLSLFDGKRPEIFQRSLSVTPDRSVLGKFFNDRKVENDPTKVLKESNRDKPKTRRVSRFLRPDFYDTPKEDSAYEKKEKVKNVANGEIWKEKTKQSTSMPKKSSKKSQEDTKNVDNRMSIVDKAIRSLKENSLGRNDYESMSRESNLIKRAVSLEDCSLVPESRAKRSTSLTPQSNYEKKTNNDRYESMFQKKKFEDYKKIVDQKLNSKNKDNEAGVYKKQESVIDRIARKLSPKNLTKQKTSEQNGVNGVSNPLESRTTEDTHQDGRSRLSRIAGLKRLEFNRPIPSADSTPSVEESKFSGDFDDSSSFLSPTEDGSDTWSVSSEYADARDVLTPSANEDSVSDRIRRKSFYSRFNQTKRRKSSQSGSKSRLPMYSKSMTCDLTSPTSSKPSQKISDPEAPVEK